MSSQFSFARTACLLNSGAQCTPIWISRPEGLRLAHFQTPREGVKQTEDVLPSVSYKSCERGCLHAGRSPKDTRI
jgi:hypothetical protein